MTSPESLLALSIRLPPFLGTHRKGGCRSSENTSPGNRVGAGRVHCCGGVERLHQWELRCCCFYKVKSIYAVVCGNASLDK